MDGALGFWNAYREVFAAAKEQRCRFHKKRNELNAMPKSVQAKAKGHLHDIHWPAGYCAAMPQEAGRLGSSNFKRPPNHAVNNFRA